MTALQNFKAVNDKIKTSKTSLIKAFHEFVFENEGDRQNRKRLREFDGFNFDENDAKYKNKSDYIEKKLDVGDLVSICNILGLDYRHKDLKLFIFKNLKTGNLLKDGNINEEDSEDESEEEIDDKLDDNKSYRSSENISVSTVAADNNVKPVRFALNFRDIEDSVRQFSGNEDLPVEIWVEEFENMAEILGWDDFQKYVFGKKSVTGLAKSFIRAEKGIISWRHLKSALLKEFKTVTNSAKIHQLLSEKKMKKHQSTQEYFYEMKEIASRGNIEESALFEYIIEGIEDLNINKTILYGAKNTEDFKEKLRSYDVIKSKITQAERKKSESKKTETRKIKFENKCYNCGEKGHIARSCINKEKGTKCFNCDQFGHISRDCRNESKTNNKTNMRFLEVVDDIMNKKIRIQNQNFIALFDTGSKFNVISYNAYEILNKPKLEESNFYLTGFGKNKEKNKIKPLGHFQQKVEIDADIFELIFHVVSPDCMDVEIIIGKELCKLAEIKINTSGVHIQKIAEKNDEMYEIMQINAVIEHNEINIGEDVKPETKQKIYHLFKNYRAEKNKTTNVEMNIILNNDTPIFSHPRRLPFSEREIVDKQVEQWLADGIIEESNSEFSSPVVLVKKRDGTPRLCIDYRRINKVVVKDRFPLPLIEDQLDRLQEAKIFSTLDLKNGFFHVPVNESSRKYTSFVTHRGQYQFCKVPFGLSNSPGVFQRHINCIFRGLTQQGIALPYIDDIIIPAKDETEGLQRVEQVLELCRDYGLEINKKKCNLLKKKIEFLGHVIEDGQISPSTEKTKAVAAYPEIKNLKQLESFLGLTGYFRKFVSNYATIAKPLSDLRKQNRKFEMGEQQVKAFKKLKECLIHKPVLNIYNQQYETEVHTDASIDGYGAVLLQKSPESGKFHPVHFMSKKTNDQERKYSSYELEILAVIEALKKFRVYLLGTKFKIVTDCNAFTKTLEKKDLSTRVARWILFLEEFQYTVEHRSGSAMRHVDALSRHPIMLIEEDNILSRIKHVQSLDDDLKTVKDILGEKPYKDYFLKNDLLYKLINGRELLVIPKGMQNEIIKQAHDKGHFAINKTTEILKHDYYIPNLNEKVQRCISNCVTCIISNKKRGKQEGELHPLHKDDTPLCTYHIDFLGPLETTNKNYNHILAVIDGFTKFVWLYPVKTTSSRETIMKLNIQKNIFGSPRQIISDKGSAFTSEEFRQYCDEENINHIKVTTGLPRANGQVERLNSVIISVLTKISRDDATKWYKNVDKVQQTINSTFNRAIQTTPFELLVGVKMRTKDDIVIRELLEEELASHFQQTRESLRKSAKQQILKLQEENKKSYNLRRKTATKYYVGELVAIKRTQLGGGLKLKPKYLGPYKIVKVKQNDTYDVAKEGLSEGPKFTSTCAEFIKPWPSVNNDDDE